MIQSLGNYFSGKDQTSPPERHLQATLKTDCNILSGLYASVEPILLHHSTTQWLSRPVGCPLTQHKDTFDPVFLLLPVQVCFMAHCPPASTWLAKLCHLCDDTVKSHSQLTELPATYMVATIHRYTHAFTRAEYCLVSCDTIRITLRTDDTAGITIPHIS